MIILFKHHTVKRLIKERTVYATESVIKTFNKYVDFVKIIK